MEDHRKLKVLWCLTCFVLVIATTECKFVDEDCVAEEAEGSCKLLSNCPTLLSEIQRSGSPIPLHIRKKLNRLTCGFVADQPIVCCQKSNPGNQDMNNGNPQPTPAATNDERVVNVFNMITNRNKAPVDVRGHRNFNLLPTNCGFTESDRITGGNRTQLYEMPWMALIAYDTPRGVKLSCGATLINEWYLLTAAHCVSFLGSRLKLAYVVIGEYDIRSNPDCERVEGDLQCAPSVQNITITEAIAHPGYSPQNLYDDIAILRLSQPADFTLDSQKPVCLPVTPDLQMESLVGLKTIAAGWGATEDGLQSPVLLSVDLPVMSNEDCEKVLRTSIKDMQLCAGGIEGKDSCAGDSGGPLIYPGKVGAYGIRQVQRGIVSFGSKRCGVVGFPGVYTNIAYYMDWILENMHE